MSFFVHQVMLQLTLLIVDSTDCYGMSGILLTFVTDNRTSHGTTECTKIYSRSVKTRRNSRSPAQFSPFLAYNHTRTEAFNHSTHIFDPTAGPENAMAQQSPTSDHSDHTSSNTTSNGVNRLTTVPSLFSPVGQESPSMSMELDPSFPTLQTTSPVDINQFLSNRYPFERFAKGPPSMDIIHQTDDVNIQLDHLMNMTFLDFPAQFTPGPGNFHGSEPSPSGLPFVFNESDSPFDSNRWGPPPNRTLWTKLTDTRWEFLIEQLPDEEQVSSTKHS
jgi:hypothetical protein